MSAAAPSSEISPYDRLYMPDEELVRHLETGAHRRELQLYFGADDYADLTGLAAQAGAAADRSAYSCNGVASPGERPIVWLIPGIMGSQLGLRRGPDAPPDLIWLDPADVIRGDLRKLRLDANSPICALGLVHHSYLRLWLRLLAAGFEVRPFAYDWRRDLRESGAALAAAIAASARPALLVAHSLGGLVARAALTDRAASSLTQRVVQLGTPNNGAAAARLAVQGCYPVVRRAAMLDRHHSAKQLAEDVFASFRSIWQLLPDSSERPTLLAEIDRRYVIVVGTGQVTCAQAIHHSDGWRFEYTRDGDGTVSRVSACAPNTDCYLTPTEHSELARSAEIAAATVDLLRTGTTRQLTLANGHATQATAAVRVVKERELHLDDNRKIDWLGLSPEQRRHFLENLNSPLAIPALDGL